MQTSKHFKEIWQKHELSWLVLLNVIFANFLRLAKPYQLTEMLLDLNEFCVKHLNVFDACLHEKHIQPIQGKKVVELCGSRIISTIIFTLQLTHMLKSLL